MTAAESAEVFLIVVKRLGKWALWLLSALAAIFVLALAWEKGKEYIDNRPYRAVRYADIGLGDAQKEVLYVLGPPPHFIHPARTLNDGNPFSKFGRVVDGAKPEEKVSYTDSNEWLYTVHQGRTDVAFDKAGGRVTSIACFSESSYSCPSLYGIRDGSSEDDVLSQLGKPASEELDGVTKTVRYPQYNLTVYLEKRRVYMLKVSEGAAR